MSTSAGSMLSFLRFRARRRSSAQVPAGPASSQLANLEPPGPGLGALVRVPAHSAPTATMPASWPSGPCVPPATMLARTLPDASLLTPAATIPTVLVPVMRTPATATSGQEAHVEESETTTLPSRRDATATTIHPRRAR